MRALVQRWIEELSEQGQCSRLMVDSTIDAVEVPDWVKEQWAEALPIDLDPTYPLDLRYEDEGLYCCLSFGGPWDCFFPWRSIYVVQDRDSQIGVVIDENLPPKLEMELKSDVGPGVGGEPPAESAHEPTTDLVSDAEEVPSETPQSESAETMRARFRVIDGGKS